MLQNLSPQSAIEVILLLLLRKRQGKSIILFIFHLIALLL